VSETLYTAFPATMAMNRAERFLTYRTYMECSACIGVGIAKATLSGGIALDVGELVDNPAICQSTRGCQRSRGQIK